MAKIIYNACFGGFGLSDAAVRRYAELKGLTLYPEVEHGFTTYWTIPKDQRGAVLSGESFHRAPMAERKASNEFYSANTVDIHRADRCDPVLVQVVEELGEAANGKHAMLRIAEIASGDLYRIDEYDGRESVETKDTYEWRVAP